MKIEIYVAFLIAVVVLPLMFSDGSIFCGHADSIQHQTKEAVNQADTAEKSTGSIAHLMNPSTSTQTEGEIQLGPGALAAIAVASLIIGVVSFVQQACEDDPLWIIATCNVQDKMYWDGIQVGDYFYVYGEVVCYAGKPGRSNVVEITINIDDVLQDSIEYQCSQGGTITVPYEWKLQAAKEATFDVEVEAKVTGWVGAWWCWTEEKQTKSTTVTKTITTTKPYDWSVSDPDPDEVYHKPHPTQPTESTLTSMVASRTQATLEGYLLIDEDRLDFSLEKDEVAPHSKTKPHEGWPHIDDRSFYFEGIKIEAWIDLEDGRRWSKTELEPKKEVTCHGYLPSPEDYIDWGDIVVVTPLPYLEAQPIDFEFQLELTEPGDVTYTWDFNDTTPTQTGKNIIHAFEDDGLYNVSVTAAWNGFSNKEWIYMTVGNTHPAISSITVAESALVGESISFNSIATDLGVQDVLTYTWTFGDGNSASGDSVNHAYSNYGHFTYILSVTDGDKGFNITSGIIWVKGTSPTSDAGGLYYGIEGSHIEFDGTGSVDADGRVSIWRWDFGDGTIGWGHLTTHKYQEDGTYTVKLKVIDDNALENEVSTTVELTDIDPEFLRIAFDYETEYRVRFSADYNSSNPYVTLLYTWNFGDGSSLELGNVVTHTYIGGNYVVTLTVDDGDSSVQKTEQISIPATGKVSSYSLDVNPLSRTVHANSYTTYNITATSFKNFSSPLTMSINGLPSGAFAEFIDLRSKHPYANLTLRIWAQKHTLAGDYPLTIRGQSDGKIEETTCTLTVENEPDLIITGMYAQGSTIYYVIKNQGYAIAGSSHSKLWVDGSYKATDYVSSLAPGSSSTESFSYNWIGSGLIDIVKICADSDYEVDETSETNNCLERIWEVTNPPKSVGGFRIPVDTTGLPTVHIISVIAIIATVAVIYSKHRSRHKKRT